MYYFQSKTFYNLIKSIETKLRDDDGNINLNNTQDKLVNILTSYGDFYEYIDYSEFINRFYDNQELYSSIKLDFEKLLKQCSDGDLFTIYNLMQNVFCEQEASLFDLKDMISEYEFGRVNFFNEMKHGRLWFEKVYFDIYARVGGLNTRFIKYLHEYDESYKNFVVDCPVIPMPILIAPSFTYEMDGQTHTGFVISDCDRLKLNESYQQIFEYAKNNHVDYPILSQVLDLAEEEKLAINTTNLKAFQIEFEKIIKVNIKDFPRPEIIKEAELKFILNYIEEKLIPLVKVDTSISNDLYGFCFTKSEDTGDIIEYGDVVSIPKIIPDNRKQVVLIPKIYLEVFLTSSPNDTDPQQVSKIYTMMHQPLSINEIGENIFAALSQENGYQILNQISTLSNNEPIVITTKNLPQFKQEIEKARKLNLSKYPELKTLPKEDYNYLWDMITENFVNKVEEGTGFTITKRSKPVGF